AAEVVAQGPQGRRGHYRVTDPVGQEDRHFHVRLAVLSLRIEYGGRIVWPGARGCLSILYPPSSILGSSHAAPSRCSRRVVEWPWYSGARWTRPPYDSTRSAPATSWKR